MRKLVFGALLLSLIVSVVWGFIPALVDFFFDVTPKHTAAVLLWGAGDFGILFVLWCMNNAHTYPERMRAERAEQEEYERMKARHVN